MNPGVWTCRGRLLLNFANELANFSSWRDFHSIWDEPSSLAICMTVEQRLTRGSSSSAPTLPRSTQAGSGSAARPTISPSDSWPAVRECEPHRSASPVHPLSRGQPRADRSGERRLVIQPAGAPGLTPRGRQRRRRRDLIDELTRRSAAGRAGAAITMRR